MDGMTISELIKKLDELKKEHGDLEVFYASDYDWCLPIKFADVRTDPGWEDAPTDRPSVYLN